MHVHLFISCICDQCFKHAQVQRTCMFHQYSVNFLRLNFVQLIHAFKWGLQAGDTNKYSKTSMKDHPKTMTTSLRTHMQMAFLDWLHVSNETTPLFSSDSDVVLLSKFYHILLLDNITTQKIWRWHIKKM